MRWDSYYDPPDEEGCPDCDEAGDICAYHQLVDAAAIVSHFFTLCKLSELRHQNGMQQLLLPSPE